jgi:flavin-dependent dehydrogenase
MTVAQIQAYVGAPARPTESYQRERGDILETAWAGAMDGTDGWWFALTRGRAVLALGWTAGSRRDRDIELSRALTAHAVAIVVTP